MIGYERTYATGRSVSSVLEFFGWAAVVCGIMVALFGFAIGGEIGSFGRGNGAEFFMRIFAALPGIGLVFAGLFSVYYCQVGKATLDTAEMQRELLQIARGGIVTVSSNNTKSDGQSKKPTEIGKDDEIAEEFEIKGRSGKVKLRKSQSGVYFAKTPAGLEKEFQTIDEAKEYFS